MLAGGVARVGPGRQGAADYVLKSNLGRLPAAVRRAVEHAQAVANSESRFYKVAAASFDGIAVTQEGVLREVNRGFVTMFGYESDDKLIGRHATDVVAPESRPVVRRQIEHGIEGTYEFTRLRRDGSTFLVQATAKSHPVGGRPGRITALRNVSAQRELDAQFRQAQKMEAIGRLAGGVAHDFSNLLTVISSYAEFLMTALGEGDPRRGDVEQISSAAEAATGLTRQLLAFSRQHVIEARVLPLESLIATTERPDGERTRCDAAGR